MTDREPIIGIDLGTTFSLVAYCDDAGPRVIRDESGEARLPSVICVRDPARSEISVGWDARNHAVENPTGTVYSIKRLIGKSPAEIRTELPFLAYHVAEGPRESVRVEINGRLYAPEEISSVILRELKARAERHFGQPVRKAVITVPAYFDDAQRQATRDAGGAAGLEVVRILNEPTAAALAYGIGVRDLVHSERDTTRNIALPLPKCSADESKSAPGERTAEFVAVYDLGGGTFDVSILRIEDGVFQVLSTAGDTHLGGDDFDRALIQLVTTEIQQQFDLSIDSPRTRQALRGLAEQVKIRLSDRDAAELELQLGADKIYRRKITCGEFEALISSLADRTLALTARALADARLTAVQLDRFILVGGSTRVPLVRRRIAEHFGVTPYTALNPDEVVALGAAVQASILAGRRRDALLLDVTPLSLGIETLGGAMGKLILRNTAIPARITEMFTTFVDGQTAIDVHVLQGERELAADCRTLGRFELRGIPPMPAGIPKVEVEFLIDANGILSVSARELRSGRQAGIQIVPSYGLTREEVERMQRESIAFAKADLSAHRRIDLVNQIEFDTAKTEQMLARVGDQLEPYKRERIHADVVRLRELARTATDLDELHRELEAFGRGTVELAELGIKEALRAP